MTKIDFSQINSTAMRSLNALLARWLPDGRRQGQEYIARNPKRVDHNLGSFRVNLRTGRWADFATDDRGGDVVSLAAYIHDISQTEAARRIAEMLGMETAR